MPFRSLVGLVVASVFFAAPRAAAGPPGTARSRPMRGRPHVVLDELVFPDDVPAAPGYKKHLRQTLAREARRADWGAGRTNRIEYRFYVTELQIEVRDEAL